MKRVSIAQNTLEILESRTYLAPSGTQVGLGLAIESCLMLTRYYEPDELLHLEQPHTTTITQFEVRNETTLDRYSTSCEF